jgi:O-antigen/teichoic acid export membrane protein
VQRSPFSSYVVLARVMRSFDHSVLVLLSTTVVMTGTLSCLGFHTSVICYAPEDDDEKRRLLKSCAA